MSQKRARVKTVIGGCCPVHTTDAIAKALSERWLQDVRESAVNGSVDSIAAIVAAELVKRSMVTLMERGYAAHGPAAVEQFQVDLAAALERIQALPVEGAS